MVWLGGSSVFIALWEDAVEVWWRAVGVVSEGILGMVVWAVGVYWLERRIGHLAGIAFALPEMC